MKILLLGEYSGLHNELKRGLVELGHHVTIAASNDFWKKFPVDINLGCGSNIYSYKLRQLVLPFLQAHKLVGFDVVHLINPYIMPRSLFINKLLLRHLKENNNIVTLSGAGDDPFFVNYAEKTMRYSPIPSMEKYDLRKDYYMRGQGQIDRMHEFVELVDQIIPIMYEYYSTFIYAGYQNKTVKPIPVPISKKHHKIDSNKIQSDDDKLTFFHGINRPGFKGTHIVLPVFEKLSERYKEAEFLSWGQMPFDKYIKAMARVDVVVDQLYSYSLGLNGLFSMAGGKVVVGGNELESHIIYGGESPPVFNTLPDALDLSFALESIIENRSMLIEWSKMSRDFVARHHNHVDVAARYIDVWSKLSE